MMSITLSGAVYEIWRDTEGFPLVIRLVRPGMWREASPEVSLRVLAGFAAPAVKTA